MIKKISLKNFRNHDNLNLELKNKFVYINGPNGSGKTSILESIYLVSTLKSHRTNSDKNLIKENMPFAKVEIKTNDHQYELVISEKGKVAKYDNKEARKLSEFIGKLKVVMFSPEDLNLIKGSPGVRRSFIDVELMKLDYNYLNNLTKYRNILKQRNALLKNIKIGDDLFFLNILGKKLYEIGIKIIDVREKFIKDLNTKFIEIYEEFNQENKVSIKYIPNLSKEELEKHLTKNQKIDILYKATTQGPHRDDFTILFDGYEAKNYASQGQIRLIVIAVKLALLQIIREVSKGDVILLLDDVLSELDSNIREKFLNNLPKEIQIIMNSAMNIKNEEIQIIELKENSK